MIEYTHDQLEHAAQAHARRRAELNGEVPPERPIWMRRPEWQNRCIYCGDVKSDKRISCCGEVHFEESPECPSCGCDVDACKATVTGIETSIWRCTNCNWESDPE